MSWWPGGRHLRPGAAWCRPCSATGGVCADAEACQDLPSTGRRFGQGTGSGVGAGAHRGTGFAADGSHRVVLCPLQPLPAGLRYSCHQSELPAAGIWLPIRGVCAFPATDGSLEAFPAPAAAGESIATVIIFFLFN